jgi:hypothetical protein
VKIVRLPIYRNLKQRLEILGLSPIEFLVLCLCFLLLTYTVSGVRFGSALVLGITFGLAVLLRFLHRRFESHYAEKLIRFTQLPDGLHRRLMDPAERRPDAAPIESN